MVIDFTKIDIFEELIYSLQISKAQKLYKYVPFSNDIKLNEKKIDILRNNLAYLSSPLMFNDPYDCELSFNFIDGFEDFLKISTNRETRRAMERNIGIKENIKNNTLDLQIELTNEWNRCKKNIKVCCLSEQLDNFLMWSHYSNCYNGICIEYDKYKVCLMNTIFPIIYTDKLIRARDFMKKGDFYKNIPKDIFEAALRAVFSKHVQWKYEKEWRIIEYDNKNDKNHVQMPIPEKIYIGFKVNDIIRNEIMSISDKLGISGVYNTKISSNEYKLIHEPIK